MYSVCINVRGAGRKERREGDHRKMDGFKIYEVKSHNLKEKMCAISHTGNLANSMCMYVNKFNTRTDSFQLGCVLSTPCVH